MKHDGTDAPSLSALLSDLVDTMVRSSLERIGPPNAAGGPALFDRKGAADYLAIGTSTLDELRRTGHIKTVSIKGRPKYPRKELDRYAASLANL